MNFKFLTIGKNHMSFPVENNNLSLAGKLLEKMLPQNVAKFSQNP